MMDPNFVASRAGAVMMIFKKALLNGLLCSLNTSVVLFAGFIATRYDCDVWAQN